MKIVTVCSKGLNRSVTCKWLLQFRGHEVIAAGTDLEGDTLQMLYAWADQVILMDKALEAEADIPGGKLRLWDVGPDRFPAVNTNRFNPELLGLLRGHLANSPDL